MGAVPTTRYAIVALLKEHGPLHVGAMAELLNMKYQTVQSAIRIMRNHKMLHISGWKRSLGTRGAWGAIYTLGPGQDRKPPQVNVNKQANERYREKYREVLRRRMSARRGRPVDHWLAVLGGI